MTVHRLDPTDPALHRIADPIENSEFGSKELFTLVTDLLETARSIDICAGLAAPQIGVSKRVIVVRFVNAHTGRYPRSNFFVPICNPVWREVPPLHATVPGDEYCLSVPGQIGEVRRHSRVNMTGRTWGKGDLLMWHLRDFNARLVQHEIDHLDGILYLDHVPHGGLRIHTVHGDPRAGSGDAHGGATSDPEVSQRPEPHGGSEGA